MAAREAQMPQSREAAIRDSVEPRGKVCGKARLQGKGAAERAVRPNDQRPGADVASEQEEMPWASRPRAGEEGHASDAGRGAAGGEPGDCRIRGGSGGVMGRTA